MMRQILLLTILMLCCASTIYAQPKNLVKSGNKLYEQKKYKEASAAYMEAVKKNPAYTPGIFNLGNALYQQKQYEGARKVLEGAVKTDTTKTGKAAADYNIGNTYMAEQKWQEAVDAYKKTLRANPQDADAKYNLSYAQQMLKKNGGGGGKDNKDNKDKKDDKNKDKQQDQENKDENKKDEQKKDEPKDGKDKDDKKEEQDKRPQPQQSKLSEKQAEQLLNALQQEEKKLQDKNKKAKGVPVKVEKDW